MSQIINTNVMSLNAQRNLAASNNDLSTAIQRLSSGLRINSAKDDAAGLAISERFTTQIRGLEVAVRNANDGISLAQTAEGAMVEVSNNLQRIRELAVQASNATNSESDRKALQAEVSQLVEEISRVATQTNFNNINLLDGSFTGAQFQVGADAGQTIAIAGILNANANALGSKEFASYSIDAQGTEDGAGPYASKAIAPKTITIGNTEITVPGIDAAAYSSNTAGVAAKEASVNYAKQMVTAINAKSSETNVIAESDDTGKITLTRINGSDAISVTLKDDTDELGTAATVTRAVKDFDITTFGGAQLAILIADTALEAINGARADLGAIQNRFSSTIANLSTTSENLSASRSRIQDTDYAAETAELTRTQILQQAGTAMLAQANSIPNNVLSLLQQ